MKLKTHALVTSKPWGSFRCQASVAKRFHTCHKRSLITSFMQSPLISTNKNILFSSLSSDLSLLTNYISRRPASKLCGEVLYFYTATWGAPTTWLFAVVIFNGTIAIFPLIWYSPLFWRIFFCFWFFGRWKGCERAQTFFSYFIIQIGFEMEYFLRLKTTLFQREEMFEQICCRSFMIILQINLCHENSRESTKINVLSN